MYIDRSASQGLHGARVALRARGFYHAARNQRLSQVRLAVLILLYVCLHTAVFVSSCCYMCVLILLYVCLHTAIDASEFLLQ
jgi:hypothetical protein